jgi:hypothetical protein
MEEKEEGFFFFFYFYFYIFIYLSKSLVPDILSNYYLEVVSKGDRPPVYCPDLGLAIEGLPDGYTINQIWNDLT